MSLLCHILKDSLTGYIILVISSWYLWDIIPWPSGFHCWYFSHFWFFFLLVNFFPPQCYVGSINFIVMILFEFSKSGLFRFFSKKKKLLLRKLSFIILFYVKLEGGLWWKDERRRAFSDQTFTLIGYQVLFIFS